MRLVHARGSIRKRSTLVLARPGHLLKGLAQSLRLPPEASTPSPSIAGVGMEDRRGVVVRCLPLRERRQRL
eukprot:9282526-Alexandrium_andersonii.AAC.1